MSRGLTAWHSWFDDATIARAIAYADDGAVEQVRVQGEAVVALVQGHHDYRVRITAGRFVLDAEKGILVEALDPVCSCPVGYCCKHAAAALISLARARGIPDGLDGPGSAVPPEDRTQPDPEPSPSLPVAQTSRDASSLRVGEWLHAIGRAVTVGNQDTHRLCWHLHAPDQRGDARWRIEPVLAKRLKSGAWGVGRRFADAGRALEQLANALPPGDIALLRRVAALHHPRFAWEPGWLDAACGATGDLLAELIEGGACYVERFGASSLRRGPAQPATVVWKESREGWRLDLRIMRGVAIPTDPPWWIAGDEAGAIETALDRAAIDAIRAMPPVPAAMLPAALPVLARVVPGLPDAPVSPAAVPPTGFLLCCRARLSPPYAQAAYEVDALAVWLRYGEVLVEADGAATARVPGGDLVVRDLPAEQALLAQLAGFGLSTDHELGLTRGRGAPRCAGPLALHQASFAEAQRQGRLQVGMPAVVLAAARAAGWTVEGGEAEALPDLAVEAIEVSVAEPEGIDWFEVHLGVRLGDERIDVTPMIARLVAGGPAARNELPRVTLGDRAWLLMSLPDGRLVRLPEAELLRLAAQIEALFDAQPPAGRGWRVDAAQALHLHELAGALGGERLARTADVLRRLAAPVAAPPPPGLTAELRPYQRVGLGWLQRLRETGMGGILADDMGLGKTVQVIAFLCDEQAAGRLDQPALVVCPASVVGTWVRELARFAPGLRVGVLHGTDRERDATTLSGFQVIITTYGTLLRDQDLIASLTLHLVVCDEAQTIKNASAKAGAAVRRLRPRLRLALSGTPMENHLGELHTLLHWLAPGLLGERTRFERVFRKPIEQGGDVERAALLRRRIAPFVLRRSKEQVAPELPPRSEVQVPLDLTPVQRELYESVRLAMDRRIRDALAAKGLARSRIDILDALLKLRQVCCDPRLVRGGGVKTASSAKLDWLAETLPELVEDGRRILLFSQFTSLLDLVEGDVLKPAGLTWLRLDGSTRDRQPLVERFQAGEAPVFLLSLKAGGTGLTLTAADTVILLDPWWNPAAEMQAADRAHRIGQDKPVFIYRPVCSGTVEERIQELQARKRGLAEALWDGEGQLSGELTEADIAALLAPLPG